MPNDLNQHRHMVGIFASILYTGTRLIFDKFTCYCIVVCASLGTKAFLIISLLLLCCGDIHPNPGPDTNFFSVMHLNIRSLIGKIDLIHAEYNTYDIICLSETWLNRDIPNKDIMIPGYHIPIRRDRLTRGGGVAIY